MDAFGDACDPCPLDAANDADGDGVCGDGDLCPGTPLGHPVDVDGCSCIQTNQMMFGCPTTAYVDDDWSMVQPGTDPNGPMDPPTCFGYDGFATIQEAIDAVCASTVNVAAGTYNENIVLNKSVTLNGAQSGVDACDRMATESIITPADAMLSTIELRTGCAGSIIDGFTFSGGSTTAGNAPIASTSGPLNNLQILNNRFVSITRNAVFLNDTGTDITVHQNSLDGSSNTTAVSGFFHLDTDNFNGFHFTDNCVFGAQFTEGFFVDGNHNVGPSAMRNPLIDGNLFDNNSSGANLGTRAFGSQFTPNAGTISDNTFSNNLNDGLQGGPQNVLITRNTFSGNLRWGLALTSFGNMNADRGAQNCSITENCFSNNGGGMAAARGDVLFSATQAPGTISTNHLNGNTLGSSRAVHYDELTVGQEETIDCSANWWGSNSGPTLATHPSGTGGMITGTTSNRIDFTPWFDTGMDTMGTCSDGFQGDFSTLHVDDDSPQFGPVARIQEGHDLVSTSTVIVHPGTYTELVNVTKSVTFLGEQDGVSGCDVSRPAMGNESIVDNSGGGFQVLANGVTIDGFIIEDATMLPLGCAVYLSPGFSGHVFKNNIVRDNVFGLYLNSNGVTTSTVERNRFHDNNVAGPANGNGIYSDQGLSNADITDNCFNGDNFNTGVLLTTSVGNPPVTDVDITTNTFTDSLNRVLLFNTHMSSVTGNAFTNGDAARAVLLAGGCDDVEISGNTMTNRTSRAIGAADFLFGFGPNSSLTVSENIITQDVSLLAGSGAMIDLADVAGTSVVDDNEITLSGMVGGPVTFIHALSLSGAATGTIDVTNNDFHGGNIDAPGGGSESDGIRLASDLGMTAVITIGDATDNAEHNTITGFVNGVESETYAGPTVLVNRNRIFGNSLGYRSATAAAVDAENNWWGAASGPLDTVPTMGGSEADHDILPASCVAMVNTQTNVDGAGNGVTSNVDYCPWLTESPDPAPANHVFMTATTCPPDDSVTIELRMEDLGELVTGYDFTLEFDPSLLSFVSGAYNPMAIFDIHLNSPITVTGGNRIELDGSCICAGTMADELLVTLTFDKLPAMTPTICDQTTISFVANGTLYQGLAFQGDPVPTKMEDLTFELDSDPPEIDCPAKVAEQCEEGIPAPFADLTAFTMAGGSVVDDCDADPDFALFSDSGYVGDACSGTVTRVYRATDACGNSADCTHLVNVEDTIDPTVSCPAGFSVQCEDDVPAPYADLAAFTMAGGMSDDNCDDDLTLSLFSDTGLVGGGCGGTVTRTYRVTDDCGNFADCMQVITVDDTMPPVFDMPTQADITTNADAGGCTASVMFESTATDNCDDTPTIEYTADFGMGPVVITSPHAFPVGTWTVTATASDDCMNSATDTFTVTVNAVNDATVTVVLDDVTVATTRCIKFIAKNGSNCAAPVFATAMFTPSMMAGGAVATFNLEVPCGDWTEICAKDEQHTLYDTVTLTDAGTTFTGDADLVLLGGDTDNDSDVDILDVTFLLFRINSNTLCSTCQCAAGGTTSASMDGMPPCTAPCPMCACEAWTVAQRDADFSNNGNIGTEDFSIQSANWQQASSCTCAAPASGGPDGRKSVPIRELPADVGASVDTNGDGVFDVKDIEEFETRHGLDRSLSSRLRSTGHGVGSTSRNR